MKHCSSEINGIVNDLETTKRSREFIFMEISRNPSSLPLCSPTLSPGECPDRSSSSHLLVPSRTRARQSCPRLPQVQRDRRTAVVMVGLSSPSLPSFLNRCVALFLFPFLFSSLSFPLLSYALFTFSPFTLVDLFSPFFSLSIKSNYFSKPFFLMLLAFIFHLFPPHLPTTQKPVFLTGETCFTESLN